MSTRKWKRRKSSDENGSPERQLVTGMIVSRRVLREIQPIYRPELLESRFARTIAEWCLGYFKQYDKAPKAHIQDIFNSHARRDLDEDQADLIGTFLEDISSEYERSDKFNARYVLDQAELHFKSTSLNNLLEDARTELSEGNVVNAEQLIGKYKKIERPSSDAVDPFADADLMRESFEQSGVPLFTLPGALGRMLNDQLTRDSLIGIMGSDKKGKTWLAQELAKRAGRARCNVAFFEVGDMSRYQLTVRWAVAATGRSNLKKYCGRMLVPVLDCVRNQNNKCKSKHRRSRCGLDFDEDETPSFEDAPKSYKPCAYCSREGRSTKMARRFKGAVWYKVREKVTPLAWREGLKAGKRFKRRITGRDFKLVCCPTGTMTITMIKSQLDIWENTEGFVPDVIFVDYADILAPEDRRLEYRHQENQKWMGLRALSLERHCLVISPTQTDSAAYNAFVLNMSHFSETKGKNAHVTGLIGLNQTEEEKKKGIIRYNWVVLREGEFFPSKTVKVLQCLQIGKPLIASYR